MKNIIKSVGDLSINGFFTRQEQGGLWLNEESKLQLPTYQRSYEWDSNDEVTDLLEDFWDHHEANAKLSEEERISYYLGNIILVANTSQTQNNVEILDGQQRIVTLYIYTVCIYLLTKDFLDNFLPDKVREQEFTSWRNHINGGGVGSNLNERQGNTMTKIKNLIFNGPYPRIRMFNKEDSNHFQFIIRLILNDQIDIFSEKGIDQEKLISLLKSESTFPSIKNHNIIKAFIKIFDFIKDKCLKAFSVGENIDQKVTNYYYTIIAFSNYVREPAYTKITYTMVNGGNEFDVFERLNQRGKDLSNYSLTRNLCINLSSTSAFSQSADENFEKKIIESFDEVIYKNSRSGRRGRHRSTIADSIILDCGNMQSHEKLSSAQYMKKFKSLFIKWRKTATSDPVRWEPVKKEFNNFIESLVSSSKSFTEIMWEPAEPLTGDEKKINRKIKLIGYLSNFRQYYPIYYALRFKKYEAAHIIEYLNLIEKLYVHVLFAFGNSPSSIENFLSSCAYEIYSKKILIKQPDGNTRFEEKNQAEILSHHKNKFLDKCIEAASKILTIHERQNKKEFLKKILTNQLEKVETKQNNISNYMLRNILNSISSTATDILSKDISLEHVMPKEWNKDNGWKHHKLKGEDLLNDETHLEYVNRLGNHTLLGLEENQKLSNKNWNEKRTSFDRETLQVTKHDSKIAVLYYNDWTTESINERQTAMAKVLSEIFSF